MVGTVDTWLMWKLLGVIFIEYFPLFLFVVFLWKKNSKEIQISTSSYLYKKKIK